MQNVKLIIAIVGIALAAFLIIRNFGGNTTEVGAVVQCDKCDKAFKAKVVATQGAFPIECKFCKEKRVFPLLFCKDCSSYFIQHPEDGIPCPNCGSTNLDQPIQVPE